MFQIYKKRGFSCIDKSRTKPKTRFKLILVKNCKFTTQFLLNIFGSQKVVCVLETILRVDRNGRRNLFERC